MSRRRSSYPIRCWQMLGVAALLVAAFSVIVGAEHVCVAILRAAVGR